LRRGTTGDDVRRLQEALRQRGLISVVDGVFGPQTEAAVRQFQAANSLTVDGVVGSATWAKLG
jgi:peptidoglycan hydrolase-like protein with peptidoglycan-binding domain